VVARPSRQTCAFPACLMAQTTLGTILSSCIAIVAIQATPLGRSCVSTSRSGRLGEVSRVDHSAGRGCAGFADYDDVPGARGEGRFANLPSLLQQCLR
jgi:hypothetical protein